MIDVYYMKSKQKKYIAKYPTNTKKNQKKKKKKKPLKLTKNKF